MGYCINETLKECQKFTLKEDFPKIGPYLLDQFRGEYMIGSNASSKDGVEVLIYSEYSGQGTHSYTGYRMQPRRKCDTWVQLFIQTDKIEGTS